MTQFSGRAAVRQATVASDLVDLVVVARGRPHAIVVAVVVNVDADATQNAVEIAPPSQLRCSPPHHRSARRQRWRLFDYVASEADELTLRRGESLIILQTHTDDAGWARGRLGDGREGLLPLDYVRLLPDDAAPEPQRVAVGADGGAAHAWPDAEPAELEAVDDALRRYRSRVALYNGPAELLDRWGVHIDLEGSGLPLHRQAPPSGDEPLEHRSGVGGVPFFNLAEHMEPAVLSRELVRMLRSEWLPDYTPAPAADADAYDGWLPGLDDALRAAATPEGELILTFANLGYADFVLNGFPKAVVPHTLVIALDAEAHATFTAAGLVSYFDPRMPAIDGGAHDHRTAAFMDIMKLRLLYLAEVLLRGYSALLTDADAVFAAEPFAHFPADAALSVACDATVVPRDWAEAPGMVMAGFFFARAGPRPIILIKEILDYQARHPDQHDQQSFNQILSELLVADLSVAVMHPRLFPNGFQYFVKQTVQREGIAPVVVQNNWMMGADNKRHRFREAQMWSRDADAYYRGTAAAPLRLLLYDAAQPRVSGLLRETSALRSALSLARLLNRTLVLPPLCAFTPASGLVPAPPLEYRDRFGIATRTCSTTPSTPPGAPPSGSTTCMPSTRASARAGAAAPSSERRPSCATRRCPPRSRGRRRRRRRRSSSTRRPRGASSIRRPARPSCSPPTPRAARRRPSCGGGSRRTPTRPSSALATSPAASTRCSRPMAAAAATTTRARRGRRASAAASSIARRSCGTCGSRWRRRRRSTACASSTTASTSRAT